MAETIKKTGSQGAWALTYAGSAMTAPFSMLVYNFKLDAIADIFDATSGSDGRRLGKTGLASGTLTVLGYMKVDSAFSLATTVVLEDTTNVGSATALVFNGGTGTNAGGTGAPLTVQTVISRAIVESSKTQGYVACMIQFALCGTQV